MKLLKEFKEFAIRGNLADMAIGIIIGAAFGKIITSLVNDVIMPPLGLLLGGMDFSKLAVTLKPAIGEAKAVTLNYGAFLNTVLDFLIVAACMFMVIKGMNHLRKAPPTAAPAAPPPPTKTETLLTEIRDLLKK
ncbi:MAG: large-conductance mechanosensitive channel protein MscL [Kiritimatiellaeota bacterium]|nr:large-conductance mechanosensitive channel protein MscL [Kiritimatiellota bacterium]